MTTDFTRARINMVESQLRAGHVHHKAVLAQFAAIPREQFIPPELHGLAYADLALPLGPPGPAQRVLMAPVFLARLIEALDPQENDLLLHIGCVTGYGSAILSALAPDGAVIALEEARDLAAAARRNCADLGLVNITTASSPLLEGAPDYGQFDAILVEGAIPAPPHQLLTQLKEGGRLAAIINPATAGKVSRAWRFTRTGDQVHAETLFDAQTPFLPGVTPIKNAGFQFTPPRPQPARAKFAIPLPETSAARPARNPLRAANAPVIAR